MNTLLIDGEESMRVKKDDVLSKYTELPKAIVLLGSSAWCLFEQELKGIWKDVPVYLLGVLVAAVVGYACIRLLKMIAAKGKFGAFAYYCWAVGLLTVILTLVRG